MTIEEFSNEFDVLLNSHIVLPPGSERSVRDIDEYEKSVLLTEAQEDIVRELYNGRYTGEGFENTEELRRNLDSLVKTTEPEEIEDLPKMSDTSKFYKLPKDTWFITYEVVLLHDAALGCKDNTAAEVTPVKQDEYHRVKDNPFRGPSDHRVLRIDTGNSVMELVSKYNIEKYFIKYLSKPKPIILTDITNDSLSINGEKIPMTCMLNTALHRPILERAVALAIKRMPQG